MNATLTKNNWIRIIQKGVDNALSLLYISYMHSMFEKDSMSGLA